jgi:hypothetical protein
MPNALNTDCDFNVVGVSLAILHIEKKKIEEINYKLYIKNI